MLFFLLLVKLAPSLLLLADREPHRAGSRLDCFWPTGPGSSKPSCIEKRWSGLAVTTAPTL